MRYQLPRSLRDRRARARRSVRRPATRPLTAAPRRASRGPAARRSGRRRPRRRRAPRARSPRGPPDHRGSRRGSPARCARAAPGRVRPPPRRGRAPPRPARCRLSTSPPPHARNVPEVELHGPPAGEIRRRLRQLLDVAHRPDPDAGAPVGPVVDDPVRLPAHRVEHVEPAAVAGRQQLEEHVEQRERLVVVLVLVGLPQRLAQGARSPPASPTSAERTKCPAAAPY